MFVFYFCELNTCMLTEIHKTLNVRGKAEGFFRWMIFSISNSRFKRHFPLVMESEAVLMCMAFSILRKYFWQEEVGGGGKKRTFLWCGDFPTNKEYEAIQEISYCLLSKTP